MQQFFDMLGGLVALYVVYGFFSGSVAGRSGIAWRRWEREAQPRMYWSVMIVYALLAIALITIF